MNRHRVGAGAAARLGSALVVLLGLARVCAAGAAPADDQWRFDITPFLWLAGVDGSTQTREVSVPTDVDFDDAVAHLEFGAMLHAEVGKGKWSVLFDGLYIDIGTDGTGPLGRDINAGVSAGMVDLALAYEFADIPLSKSESTPRLMLDAIGGARYISISVSVDPDRLPSQTRSADLIDPYVGARARFAVTNKLTFALKGTVGGFGVGSDLDWTATAIVDYRITSWFSVLAGYHAMGLDFEDGDAPNKLSFDAILHGPVIGMTFHF